MSLGVAHEHVRAERREGKSLIARDLLLALEKTAHLMKLAHLKHRWIGESAPAGHVCLRCVTCGKTKIRGTAKSSNDAVNAHHATACGIVP